MMFYHTIMSLFAFLPSWIGGFFAVVSMITAVFLLLKVIGLILDAIPFL